jgi:hypothetical protein
VASLREGSVHRIFYEEMSVEAAVSSRVQNLNNTCMFSMGAQLYVCCNHTILITTGDRSHTLLPLDQWIAIGLGLTFSCGAGHGSSEWMRISKINFLPSFLAPKRLLIVEQGLEQAQIEKI